VALGKRKEIATNEKTYKEEKLQERVFAEKNVSVTHWCWRNQKE